jgi:hypothetical protein
LKFISLSYEPNCFIPTPLNLELDLNQDPIQGLEKKCAWPAADGGRVCGLCVRVCVVLFCCYLYYYYYFNDLTSKVNQKKKKKIPYS